MLTENEFIRHIAEMEILSQQLDDTSRKLGEIHKKLADIHNQFQQTASRIIELSEAAATYLRDFKR